MLSIIVSEKGLSQIFRESFSSNCIERISYVVWEKLFHKGEGRNSCLREPKYVVVREPHAKFERSFIVEVRGAQN